jgi:hypothetical protein
MRTSFAVKRSLMSVLLLGIASLAVLALAPDLLRTFGIDGSMAFAMSRPVAPVVAQPEVSGNGAEASILANWEFTSFCNHFDRRHHRDEGHEDVLRAFREVSDASFDVSRAFFARRSRTAFRFEQEAASEIFAASRFVSEAARETRSPFERSALRADATALAEVSLLIRFELRSSIGGFESIFSLTQVAEFIVIKTIRDVSPSR